MNPIDIAKQCIAANEKGHCVLYPSDAVALYEVSKALEAAERERDELRAEQAEHDEQIARMEGKFSLAKRALDSKTARCEKAETELRRRDAAAGEPVYQVGTDGHWYDCKQYIYQEAKERRDACRILYTAAPPAVLPELEQDVKNIIGLLSENEWAEHCTKSEPGRKLEGEITRLHDLLAAPAPGGDDE